MPSAIRAVATARACYKLAGDGTWAEVPGGSNTFPVLPANPAYYTTSPAAPTASQQVLLTFSGTGLSESSEAAPVPPAPR